MHFHWNVRVIYVIISKLITSNFHLYRYKRLFDNWARSYYSTEAHLSSLLAYNAPHVPAPTDDAWKQATSAVKEMFLGFGKIEAMDFLMDIKNVPYEESSSAGFAFGGPKGPRDGTTFKSALRQANALVLSLYEGSTTMDEAIRNSVPDIAFTRTQLTYLPDKLKVRNVWGEHFTYILLEGLFAYPLMQYFVTHDTFFHIGTDPRVSVPNLLRRLSLEPDPYLYSFDWSSFDASVQLWEIDFAFDLLESMLNIPNEQTRVAFNFVRTLFKFRKIAGPDGNIYIKSLGVPSGSYFTILIDSIVNYVRILYIFYRFSKKAPRTIKTQGDDSIVLVHKGQRIDLAYVAHTLKESFGWTINPTKCGEGKTGSEVDFLSRTIFAGDNYRDDIKLQRLALFPEYPVDSGEISLFRVSSIIQESETKSEALEFVHDELQQRYRMPKIDDVPKEHRRFTYFVKTV